MKFSETGTEVVGRYARHFSSNDYCLFQASVRRIIQYGWLVGYSSITKEKMWGRARLATVSFPEGGARDEPSIITRATLWCTFPRCACAFSVMCTYPRPRPPGTCTCIAYMRYHTHKVSPRTYRNDPT